MTDYGHPITFGLSLYPSVDQLSETRQLAQAADAAGLDYLAIQDHAYNTEFLDVWTLIAYLAAETDRIFSPRRPTCNCGRRRSCQVRRIAERAARGRIVLGVGGGASVAGIAAMGGIRRTASEMIEFTEERCCRCGPPWPAASSSYAATSTPSRATQPDPCRRRGCRCGWQQRPANAGGHRTLKRRRVSPLSTYVGPATVPSRQS